MLDFRTLRGLWKDMTYYERFEQIASRIVMVLISALIVYLLIFIAVDLFDEFKRGLALADVEALKDVFGSILTVLILIEFNLRSRWQLAKDLESCRRVLSC